MKPIRRELSDICAAFCAQAHNASFCDNTDAMIEAQTKRFRTAECGFAEYFGTLGEHRFFSAPGRVEICGNQTAHNNGKVFAASVDADMIAVAQPTDDNVVVVKIENCPECRVDLSVLEVKDDEKGTYTALVRGILRGFKKNGHTVGGFLAYVTSALDKRFELGERAAFETLVGTILCHLYNEGQISGAKIAQIGHSAAVEYFGLATAELTDEVACAVGGFVAVDLKDSDTPIIEPVPCNFKQYEHAVCIVNVKSRPLDYTEEYAAIKNDMKAVAGFFDCETLRSLAIMDILLNITELRRQFGDRAVLRAVHFFNENNRVERVIHALKNDRFEDFLNAVKESGDSSFKYLQNVYSVSDITRQCVSVALNVAETTLRRKGACRVHGAGFTGTIEAFVPLDALKEFKMNLEKVFGVGSCKVLTIRSVGGAEVLL